MTIRACLMAIGVLAAVLGMGRAAQAEEPKWTRPLTLAYDETNQPGWLPRVLDNLEKKKRWRLREHRLFRQNGKPTFLALNLAQAGLFDEARTKYEKTIAGAKARTAGDWQVEPDVYRTLIADVEEDFGWAVRLATTAGRDYVCPLVGIGTDRRSEWWQKWSERFRIKPD